MKRRLSILASVLMVSMLCACTPAKIDDTATQAPAAATDAPKDTAAANGGDTAQPAPAGDQAPVTISFWKWIPTEGTQTDELVAKWKELYPNITLDIVHVGESESHFQKLSAALAAGEGPTILALQVGARATQYKEFCVPLRPMAEQRWGAGWEGKFLEAALEQCKYSGEDYTVLPGGMTATPCILYNATAFERLGITSPPKTMDELKAVIEKSKTDPKIIPGIGIGAKEGWTCRDVFMGIVNQVALGKVYEAQEGKAAWTDPEFVEAFTIWQNLFKDGIFAEGSLGVSLYPDISDNYYMEGVDGSKYYIMANAGTWHGSSMTETAFTEGVEKGTRNPDFANSGMFTMPAVKEGAEPNMVVTVDVAWGLNNSATPEQQQAGFEFIAFMSAEQGQEIWSNSLQVLPCAKNIDLSKAIANMHGEPEKAGLELCQYYVENNAGPREIRYPEIANAMNDALMAVAGGMMTPEQAVQALQTASDATAR